MFRIGDWQVYIQHNYMSARIDVYMYKVLENKERAILNNEGSLTVIEQGGDIKPFITINIGEEHIFQAMADELHKHGYHPKERRYVKENELLKQHLQDMRSLVFKNHVKPDERV